MFNYKGLRAVRENMTVSDAMLDQQIEKLLEQRMKITPITDRPAQLDDELVLDYAGEIDGLFFEGGTATMQTLVLGSGMFIPGFEEQLLGRNTGDEADVRVCFPEKYHAAELAGKEAVFHCKIHEIHIKEKYKPDDDFARDMGNYESFEAFREDMRRALQGYIDRQSDNEVKDRLLNQICDEAGFEVSEKQLQAAMDYEMEMLEAQLGRQGLNIEMYCQFMKKSREELREEMEPTARRNIQRQMAIDEIARLEKIEADEASIAKALGDICAENRMTIEELQPHMDEKFQAAVAQGVINTKVLDFIRDHAEIEDVEK